MGVLDDRQTDKRTGDATAYGERERELTFVKTVQQLKQQYC